MIDKKNFIPLGSIGIAPPRPAVPTALGNLKKPWTDGTLSTPIGEVPRALTTLSASDRAGTLKVRLNINRMRYSVPPGLYALGTPVPGSPVLVSANYKLSFDTLRRNLAGIDAWIMVLDTNGINVWCAAGKGTFGTREVINRIKASGIERVVSHRRLILPQLGAPGVSAHEVRRATGFTVTYGPVRAADLRSYLENKSRATPEMRRVRFPMRDRAVLIPVELGLWARYAIPIAIAFMLISGIGPEGYSLERASTTGIHNALLFIAIFLAGAILGPLLLPWLPGRAFSLKGLWIGLFALGGIWIATRPDILGLSALSWVFITPALTSFVLMNFTGASTYTSLSGVKYEMRRAVPAQVLGMLAGAGLFIGGLLS